MLDLPWMDLLLFEVVLGPPGGLLGSPGIPWDPKRSLGIPGIPRDPIAGFQPIRNFLMRAEPKTNLLGGAEEGRRSKGFCRQG